MYIKRSTLATGAAVLLATSGMFFPATVGKAAELVHTPLLPYDLTATAPAPAASEAPLADPSAMAAAAETLSQVAASDMNAPMAASSDAASVECMAKVVLHEAGNQPRAGKIAVAQTLVNRLKAGRFGDSICEVVNQRGQFFQVSSFHPDREADGWQDAVEVSHEVLAGQAEPVAPGAMFFRASYAPANSFFRTRQRVTTVGAHIFYR
ncbi:cell wall hydrolase [Sphingomonas sp. ASY06-1R]|jgi:spore germination cell wall hydrolase CwlJ-like protein|uniref:cell wall hydrolase n=1 Tax=Sphingomonas sp. ASY06-1R TaxID=3445771 RepID=UPI003FA2102E